MVGGGWNYCGHCNYVFFNVFEVVANVAFYERVVVGKNFEYVIEFVRVEGTLGWFSCAHDEFVFVMDGQIEVYLFKFDNSDVYVDFDSEGVVVIGEVFFEGCKMGCIVFWCGYMVLLSVGVVYCFYAEQFVVMLFQFIEGVVIVQKWGEICQIEVV